MKIFSDAIFDLGFNYDTKDILSCLFVDAFRRIFNALCPRCTMVHLGIDSYYNLIYNYFLDKSISWLFLIVSVSQSRLQIVPVILLWTISNLSLFKTACKGSQNSVTATANTVNRKKIKFLYVMTLKIVQLHQKVSISYWTWWCDGYVLAVMLQWYYSSSASEEIHKSWNVNIS